MSFIDKYFDKKDKDENGFSSKSNIIKVTPRIINISPVPIYIDHIDNDTANYIMNEFDELSKRFNDDRIYVARNQDPNKEFGIFCSKNAYVPNNNFLAIENNAVDIVFKSILNGISEILLNIYNLNGEYTYSVVNSWVQKYANGNFLSPHNHVSSKYETIDNSKQNSKTFSVGYYIDDGDPDMTQTYSGTITFITNAGEMTHIRPKTGTILIWENTLMHLVNPFYSKSNKSRFMLSANILIEF